MARCPWCKTDIGELVPGKSCPKCQRIGAELPFGGSRSTPPTAAADLELDLELATTAAPAGTPDAPIPSFDGELQLSRPANAPITSAVPAAKISAPAVPAAPASDRSALEDDDDPLGEGPGADVSLDLDVGGGVGLPPSLGSPRISVPAAAGSGRSLPAPPVSQRSLPPAEAAPPEGMDPYEARALADFGPPPSFFLTPLYALRVKRRTGELGRLLAIKRDEVTRAAQRAEDALVAFAERARPLAEQASSSSLESLRAAEELMRGRDGALAGEMDAHQAELTRIDQQLAAIEHELSSAQADEKRIEGELAAGVDVKKRAEAKMKRADIEIRNAMQLLVAKKGAVP